MTGPAFVEQVVHIFKKLDVAALITGNGNALHVFLNGAINNFGNGSVVAKMNHFGPRRLHEPTHEVDGRIVAIEKRSRRNDADLVLKPLCQGFFGLNIGCSHGWAGIISD